MGVRFFGLAVTAATLAAGLSWGSAGAAQETVRVGGTGVGLALSRAIGDALHAANPDINTEVLPSLGTPGGLNALAAGAIDVSIAARALKDSERAAGARPAACLTTAVVFATSRPAAPGIALAQLPDIYSNPAPVWPDGQQLKVILRSPAGSENPYLARLVPGMGQALAAAFKRMDVPVGATDQENADLAQRIEGSFAIMTLLQIKAEGLRMTPLAVGGVMPEPATIADGSYPLPIDICFVVPPQPTAGAVAFVEFVRSDAGREIIRRHGCAPRA